MKSVASVVVVVEASVVVLDDVMVVLARGPDVVVLEPVGAVVVLAPGADVVVLEPVGGWVVVLEPVLDVVLVVVVVVVLEQHSPLLPTSEAIALPTKWPWRLFP